MPVTEGIICIFSAYYSAYYLHIIGADAAQPVLAGVGGGFAHHISRKEGFGMANMIRMGSLYLDDQPILPLVEFQQDQAIGIGKAVPGKEITWVLVNGILIADQCLLSNISWDDLNTQGLIFGKEVSIGGLRYTLRSLRVGACEGMPNEWDAALDIVGENGGVWTGKGPRFWGQERAAGIPLYRVLRGGESARLREAIDASFRYIAFGFRPVLEPGSFRLERKTAP